MKDIKIAVIGLGYVGLPLARLFSTKFETIGFDLSETRVNQLNEGHDFTLEVDDFLLRDAIDNHGFRCTTKIEDLKEFTDNITIYDPWADVALVKKEYGLDIVNEMTVNELFDAAVLAVAHEHFLKIDIKSLMKENSVIYDVKGFLDRNIVDGRL